MIGVHKLAKLFNCGKTQINTMLQSKGRIVELYEANGSAGMFQTCMHKGLWSKPFRHHVNEAPYNWFHVYSVFIECVSRWQGFMWDSKWDCSMTWIFGFPVFQWMARLLEEVAPHKTGDIQWWAGHVSRETVDSWKEGFLHFYVIKHTSSPDIQDIQGMIRSKYMYASVSYLTLRYTVENDSFPQMGI